MGILSRLFGRGEKPKTVETTASSPYRIPNPIIGFVCVVPELEPLLQIDRAALGPMFFEARASTKEACDAMSSFSTAAWARTAGYPA
jgi:hypothetical protein